MKIPRERKLVSLLILILFVTIFTIDVSTAKSGFQSATAAGQQSSFFGVDDSLPSLPGNLALNETQAKIIIKINRALRQEIQQIFTPKQLQQFASAIASGLTFSSALSILSLSEKQKDRLRIVLYSAQSQMERVLTPKQLEYIRQQ